jgi:hypothetical protein
LASPDNVTPHKFSLGYLIIPRRSDEVSTGIFCLTILMAAHMMSTRTTDIKRGDAPGECDAGSPGSGGASPYPAPRSPASTWTLS